MPGKARTERTAKREGIAMSNDRGQTHRNSSERKLEVMFHPEQLRWLESVFKPVVMGPEKSESEMRYYFGQQSVIEVIRGRVRQYAAS